MRSYIALLAALGVLLAAVPEPVEAGRRQHARTPPHKREITAPNALTLRITKNETHDIPSTLYGYMWEDVNHSGDGGLYAELLQNRAFQTMIPGTQSALTAWQPYQGTTISVTDKTKGVSDALPNSLQVQAPKVVSGPTGFLNTGYWGIKVQDGWTYNGSFYAKSPSFTGKITASLVSSTGTVYASQTISGISDDYKKFTFTFAPTSSAPNDDNYFLVTVDGGEAAGETIYFGFFSLFPPTWKGRENGMRIDLAEALASTGPSIWRFPGGNNLEGQSVTTRWKWNETIGPLENRPGRVADWGYPNTDGLGLLEYFNWIEDLGAEPILGVWDGIAAQNYSDYPDWEIVPEDELQPYIDDVINEIEFITANASDNQWGKLRASYGREEPYALKFIEIGNEDFFQAESYQAYRWSKFVTALSAKFPDLEFLATTYPSTPLEPRYTRIDFHVYSTPDWFIENAFMFDEYPRNGTLWFVGEYAVTSTNATNTLGTLDQGRFEFPQLFGSVAEAAFMTGMERNSDVVFAASYAPSLQNINSFNWSPDIITFDASSSVLSTSYYVQQLFSLNRGTQVLETSPPSDNSSFPLFWVASRNNDSGVVFIKAVNVGQDDLVADLFFDFNITGSISTSVTLSSPVLSPISGQFNVSNTLENPNTLVPLQTSYAFVFPDRFNYTFPAMSVTVLSVLPDSW